MFEVNWDEEKNTKLKKERGISFEQIAHLMEQGKILDIVYHPDSKKYKDQMICYVEIDRYVYAVPYEKKGDQMILKTAFPSRKATKKYLSKESR